MRRRVKSPPQIDQTLTLTLTPGLNHLLRRAGDLRDLRAGVGVVVCLVVTITKTLSVADVGIHSTTRNAGESIPARNRLTLTLTLV